MNVTKVQNEQGKRDEGNSKVRDDLKPSLTLQASRLLKDHVSSSMRQS